MGWTSINAEFMDASPQLVGEDRAEPDRPAPDWPARQTPAAEPGAFAPDEMNSISRDPRQPAAGDEDPVGTGARRVIIGAGGDHIGQRVCGEDTARMRLVAGQSAGRGTKQIMGRRRIEAGAIVPRLAGTARSMVAGSRRSGEDCICYHVRGDARSGAARSVYLGLLRLRLSRSIINPRRL